MQEISPGTVIDGFHIDTVAGRGGSSVVYRATDLATGSPVALKVLSRTDASAQRRLEREAEILATVHHPGIVPFRGFHQSGEHNVLVTDWVDGESLRDRSARLGPAAVTDALGLLQAIAPPLDHLHRRGIVHRDISPANILLGPDGHLTLIDLGIGHHVESTTMTSDDLLAGTPMYLAPEIIRGERADGQADQYSVGVVLHELLTGRSPFPQATKIATTLHHQLHSAPEPLDEIDATIPTALAAAVVRSLAKDPAERFDSMADFAAAALDPRPDTEPPVGGAAGRSRRFVVGAAAAAGLAAAGLAIGLNARGDEPTDDSPATAAATPTGSPTETSAADATPASALVVTTPDATTTPTTTAGDPLTDQSAIGGVPGPDWADGAAADLVCNRLQGSTFGDRTVPIDYFGDPPGREQVVDGLGYNGSPGLEIGRADAFGQYGEIIPVVPGQRYSFVGWLHQLGEVDDSEMGVSFLTTDYQPLSEGGRLDGIPAGPGFAAVLDVLAPEGAGFAVPYLYKDGSPGVVMADELIFGLADECRTQIEAR